MKQHGFARDKPFVWADRGPRSCTLVLTDDADSRAHYPFAFRLAVTYTLERQQLGVTFEVTNIGDELLPASIGAHPAFNWPLLSELPKEAYHLTFADDEPAPVPRLSDGLLLAAPRPTPIEGRTLALSERLFDDDAVILIVPQAPACATRPSVVRRSKYHGRDFQNWASGQSRAAPRSCASNPGMA